MSDTITLDRLEIHVVVSHEPDPYGQPGFTSKTARIMTRDERIISTLKSALGDRRVVVVRCADLEVHGQIFKCVTGIHGCKAILSADEIRFIKPQ